MIWYNKITKSKLFKSTLSLCLIISIFSRFMIFYIALASNLFLGERVAEGLWRTETPFFNLFAVWDSAYYMHIATHGYNSDKYWGFFPLYPLILKIFSLPFILFTNEPVVVGGFFLSNILFILLIVYFYKLTALIFKNKNIAYLSTVFLSIFPASFFFSVLYTESLFMFLTIASLYYMEMGKWKTSTVFAVLSGLTRSVGFLIFVPLLYKTTCLIKKKKSNIIYPILALLSPLIFMFYGYLMTNDSLVYLHALDKYWNVGPTNQILNFKTLPLENQIIIAPIILISLYSILYFFKSIPSKKNEKHKIPYYIYACVLLLVYLFYAAPIGFPRYALTLIPIYWFMAEISDKSTIKRDILSIASIMLLSLGTMLFVNWYWFIY